LKILKQIEKILPPQEIALPKKSEKGLKAEWRDM